jgi:hypothetical protein
VKGKMGCKNTAPFGHTDGTHGKIEAHMRKHRAKGGAVESAMKGDDNAKEDLDKKNMEYTKDSNVNRESMEKKAAKGGKIARKSGGAVSGRSAFHHGGRMPRASGGGCESNPFTSANKGTAPKGHSKETMTKGRDD